MSADQHSGRIRADLASAVVRLTRKYTGRGAASARAIYTDDTIVVTMTDLLTEGERHVVGIGQAHAVLKMRRALQEAMRTELIDAVQEITGRTVLVSLSTNHIDPDRSVEICILEPRAEGASQRSSTSRDRG